MGPYAILCLPARVQSPVSPTGFCSHRSHFPQAAGRPPSLLTSQSHISQYISHIDTIVTYMRSQLTYTPTATLP